MKKIRNYFKKTFEKSRIKEDFRIKKKIDNFIFEGEATLNILQDKF